MSGDVLSIDDLAGESTTEWKLGNESTFDDEGNLSKLGQV